MGDGKFVGLDEALRQLGGGLRCSRAGSFRWVKQLDEVSNERGAMGKGRVKRHAQVLLRIKRQGWQEMLGKDVG